MSLESGDYISQLDPANPTPTDPKSQGDDHLRLIKKVLQTQFPSLGEDAVDATAAEISFLTGASSNIQQQINAKLGIPAAFGEVGSYSLCRLKLKGDTITAGNTYNGSSLFGGIGFGIGDSNLDEVISTPTANAITGTWRAMGSAVPGANHYACTLFVRVA